MIYAAWSLCAVLASVSFWLFVIAYVLTGIEEKFQEKPKEQPPSWNPAKEPYETLRARHFK